MVVVSAPGNLFASGEHVTVYTKTALLVAPGVRTTVKVTPSTASDISVFSHSLNTGARVPLADILDTHDVEKRLVPLFKLVEKVSLDYGIEIKPMNLAIESEIPVGSGLSSSTALLVAGYFGVAHFLGADPWHLGPDEMYARLLPLQDLIHGKASGMELFSSWGGGFSLVRNRHLVKHFTVPEDKQPVCIIGDSGITRSTADVVAMVAGWKAKNPQQADALFSRIGQIIEEMDKAITAFDWEAVGRLMTENHQLLRGMGPVQGDRAGVSHTVLDAMVDAALKAGAYGAKMSGAGWGGNMFAIRSRDKTDAVVRAISEYGQAYSTILGDEGVRIED